MPRVMVCDTYYPDVFRAFPLNPAGTYDSELRALLNQSFGTADFVSRNLSALGWECQDTIVNHHSLQLLWQEKTGWHNGDPFEAQIGLFNPDVLFMQDLNIRVPVRPPVLAGQLSCPWPGDEKVKQFDVLFTSFPHFVERIERLGVKAVYLPLAFDPIVLERADVKINGVVIDHEYETDPTSAQFEQIIKTRVVIDRPYDCVFVGGVGNPSHWKRGMETLEAVAREIPTFKWWGYGYETLPSDSALRDKYQGQAFGLDMYRIFLQSKIVLNRHGEVAEGYANNMRMFEATGCGAMLVTEEAPNLESLFIGDKECVTYASANEAVNKIRDFLRYYNWLDEIAYEGQQRTLRDHTYAQRMKVVSEVLMGALCHA